MRTALIGFYGLADEPRRTKRERVNLTAKRFAAWAKRRLVPQPGLEYKAWRAQHPEYAKCWVTTGWHGQVTCVEPALPEPKPAPATEPVSIGLPVLQVVDTRPAEEGLVRALTGSSPQRQMPESETLLRAQMRRLQNELAEAKRLQAGRIQRYRDCGALRQSLPAHLR